MHRLTGPSHKDLQILQGCCRLIGVFSDQRTPDSVIQFGQTASSRQRLGGAIHVPLLTDALNSTQRDS